MLIFQIYLLMRLRGFTLTRLGNRGVPLAPEFDGDDKTVSYKIENLEIQMRLNWYRFRSNCMNKNISVTPLFWDMTNLEKSERQNCLMSKFFIQILQEFAWV